MKHRTTLALLLAATIALAGCGSDPEPPPPAPAPTSGDARTLTPGGELPPGHPPTDGSGEITSIAPPPAGSGTGDLGLSWDAPDGWIEVEPSSSVRRAQYRLPGDAGDGELVVFYFGPNQGGDPMANATRWASQFAQPDGSSSLDKLKTTERTVNGMSTLMVEITGAYTNPMSADPTIDDAMLLAAIVEGPDANWFFRVTGPRQTVEDRRGEFDAFLDSLSTGS